jgi:thioredoxin reductase (NADPH)
LAKFATKVYIIHRRDSFRASKIMTERVLNHPKIEVIWNAKVEEIMGKDKVERIKLIITKNEVDSTKILSRLNSSPESSIGVVKHKVSKNFVSSSSQLPLDGVFVAIGHRPDTDLLKEKIIQ